MVTICTTSLTFNNSTFCPHTVFMCFVWIWEQTAIISLYSINWLVFMTERESVYCAVQTGSWDMIVVNVWLRGSAMTQAVGWRPITVKAWVWSQVSPSEICSGQNDNVSGFSPSTSVFPCQYHSTNAPYHHPLHVLTRSTNGWSLGTSHKAVLFWILRNFG